MIGCQTNIENEKEIKSKLIQLPAKKGQEKILALAHLLPHYDTVTMRNSSGRRAPWTISWTVLLRRQTSDSSSIGCLRACTSSPDAAADNACKNLDLSKSVTAVDGISETLSFAHSRALTPYARVSANSA